MQPFKLLNHLFNAKRLGYCRKKKEFKELFSSTGVIFKLMVQQKYLNLTQSFCVGVLFMCCCYFGMCDVILGILTIVSVVN